MSKTIHYAHINSPYLTNYTLTIAQSIIIGVFCNLTVDNTGIIHGGKNSQWIRATDKSGCLTFQINAFRQTNFKLSLGSFIFITSLSVRVLESSLSLEFKNKIIMAVFIEESQVR